MAVRNEQVAMLSSLDRAEERSFVVEGAKQPETRWKAIWNVDKNSLACIASKHYKLVQHGKVLGDFMDACKRLNLKAKYNVENRGNRVDVDVTFEGAKISVKKGEEFFLGFRLTNSYDKTTGILVMPRVVRCVCDNGMIVPVKLGWMRGYCFRHDQIREDVSIYMERALKLAVDSNAKFKNLVELNMQDSVEWKTAKELLKNFIGSKKHFEEILKKLPKESKQKISRWDMYNAVTSYLTHGQHIAPTMSAWLENKAEVMLMTPTKDLREKFIVRLVRNAPAARRK